MNVGCGTESAGEEVGDLGNQAVGAGCHGRGDADLGGAGHRCDPHRHPYFKCFGGRLRARQRDQHRRRRIVLDQPNVESHLEADAVEALDSARIRIAEWVSLDLQIMRAYQVAIECGHRPEEAHDELRSRMIVELVRRADLLDPALVDHHNPISHFQRLLLVMRDEDRRDVYLVVQPA